MWADVQEDSDEEFFSTENWIKLRNKWRQEDLKNGFCTQADIDREDKELAEAALAASALPARIGAWKSKPVVTDAKPPVPWRRGTDAASAAPPARKRK